MTSAENIRPWRRSLLARFIPWTFARIHLRKHFNRQVCRLVPVEREPDEWERLIERLPTKRKN